MLKKLLIKLKLMTDNKSCNSCDYCNSCDSCNSCDYCDSCYSCDYCDSCDSCNYCDYCDSCNSCNYCDYCDSCDYCNSCNSCNYCYSCDSCNYCDYCDSCNYCDSCYSCDYCNSCDSCNSCDYCYYSKGLRMSEYMIFCLGDGRLESKGEGYQKNNRVFNKDVTKEEFQKTRNLLSHIKIILTKWVDKKDMTEEEKEKISVWKEIGGYLKRFTYEEAWAIWWATAEKKDKDLILNLPQFDSVIFKEITGIDVGKEAEVIEITLEEVAKLRGVSVENIRIKD